MEERLFDLDEAIEFYLEKYLQPYAGGWHWFYVNNTGGIIEAGGKKAVKDTESLVLIRLSVNQDNMAVYISNIFVPREDRKQGTGFSMIRLVYILSEKFGYELYLVDLVDYFRDKMLMRGAVVTNNYDILHIVKTTNLS